MGVELPVSLPVFSSACEAVALSWLADTRLLTEETGTDGMQSRRAPDTMGMGHTRDHQQGKTLGKGEERRADSVD